MKIKKALGIFLALVLMFSIATGCGRSSAKDSAEGISSSMQKNDYGQSAALAEESGGQFADAKNFDIGVEAPQESAALTSSGVDVQSVSNMILSQRKVIRNANLSIEVEDFNAAYAQVNSIVSAFGYIQEANISKDKRYINSQPSYITRGTIVLRVDRDKFDSIMRNIYGLGEVLDQSISTNDVTDQFFDIESRLRLLRYEQSRLEEYLKKIEEPEVIFKTESRLTDIRHEIESLTGTLNKWNNLIQLSTITLNLSEKYPEGDIKNKDNYLERLGNSFISSARRVVEFCGDLLIFLVQILPGLIIIAIATFVIYRVFRRLMKSSVKKEESTTENSIKNNDKKEG